MYQDYRRITFNIVLAIASLALILALSGCYVNLGSAKSNPKAADTTTTITTTQRSNPSNSVVSSATPRRVLAANIYRPHGKWCPTLHLCIEAVRWDTYNSSSAEGSGRIRACPPAAAETPCMKIPVKIQFTDPQEMCGKTRFSSLTISSKSESATFYLVNNCTGYQGDNSAFLDPSVDRSQQSDKIGGVIDCPTSTKTSRATSARNISCQEAQRDIDSSNIYPGSFYTKQEFLCSASGGPKSYGPGYRCLQGNRAYRFKWSD